MIEFTCSAHPDHGRHGPKVVDLQVAVVERAVDAPELRLLEVAGRYAELGLQRQLFDRAARDVAQDPFAFVVADRLGPIAG